MIFEGDDPEQAIRFDKEKFLAAVLWIVQRFSAEPDKLGKTKLHKILYYADMLSFADTGEPLTGAEYQKQAHGPTARYLAWALRELETAGKIETFKRSYFGTTKLDLRAIDHTKSHLISNYEAELLEDVCEFVSGFSAKEISEISHALPWQIVEMGQRIPYGSAVWLWPQDIAFGRADREWLQNSLDLLKSAGLASRAQDHV